MIPALESLAELRAQLGAPAQDGAGGRDARDAQPGFRGTGPVRLSLSGVNYRVEGTETPLLHDVAFDIPAGQIVSITGPSGAGKTTLLDIIVGMVAPQAGSVAFDGEPVGRGEYADHVRRRMAYVPQETVFFDADLRSNLKSLSGDLPDEAVWQALRLAEADRIPAVAAEGLDARLGELGQRFSGGERQRLGLARALLRDPGLLILDEALSAVDRTLEQRILETLTAARDRMTILIVTHRPPPGVQFDQVLRLERGRIYAG